MRAKVRKCRKIVIHNHIDYDKLAETIVRAQDKQNSQYSTTREWMKFLVIPMFWGIGGIAGLFGFGFLWHGGKIINSALQSAVPAQFSDAFAGVVLFLFGLFFVLTAAFTIASAKDIDREKDKNYVVAVFSGVVSLVALIVAVIALLKGVG